MNLDSSFFETFQSINFILPPMVKGWSLVMIVGVTAAVFLIITALFMPRFKSGYYLLIIGWLPLFLIFFSGNILNSREDYGYLSMPLADRSGERVCRFESRVTDSREWCGMFDFFGQIKSDIPNGAKVAAEVSPIIKPYFMYYLLSEYNFVDQIENSEYVIFYNPSRQYMLDGDDLFRVENGIRTSLGKYGVVRADQPGRMIIKRMDYGNI